MTIIYSFISIIGSRMKYINKILESNKTVFKSTELSLILGIDNKNTLKNILQRFKNAGTLIFHKWNLRSLKKYNKYELASKIKSKSYISLETVLQKEWVTFQYYWNTIMLISDKSLEKNIDNTTYTFSKIKDSILLNPLGIIDKWSYMIATKERAVCDRMYLTPSYYFDNLESLDQDLLEKLSHIYNKATNLRIKELLKNGK